MERQMESPSDLGAEEFDSGRVSLEISSPEPQPVSGGVTIVESGVHPIYAEADNRILSQSHSIIGGRSPSHGPIAVVKDSQLMTNPDYIVFKLPSTSMGDRAICRNYDCAKDRAVATMVRDLQVVTAKHMKDMNDRGLFPIDCITSLSFRVQPKHSIPYLGLLDIVDKLKELQELFNITLDGTDVPPVPLTQNPVSGVINSQNRPTFGWPTNKCGNFVTKLVCRHSWSISTLDNHQIEIADYCLAVHPKFDPREPIFRSPQGSPVLRQDIASLDLNRDISPVCLDYWKRNGRSGRTCLSLVSKEYVSEHGLFNQRAIWISWITQSGISISEAELICVPLYKENQYNLLFINFRTRMIQCVDTVYASDRSAWDELAEETITWFWELMKSIGDVRALNKREFTYEVVHPHWSTTIHDADSGLTTMFLMDFIGEAGEELRSMRLNEEHIRAQLRISMCAAIVRAPINIHRQAVIQNVQQFIDGKNEGSILPTLEMSNYCKFPQSFG